MVTCLEKKEREREREREATRTTFRPHQEVVEVMKDDPGASRNQLVRKVKQQVTTTEDNRRLEEATTLLVQGDLHRRFDNQASSIWAQALWELPERAMKFALYAAQDTLPHNANLYTCGGKCHLLTVPSALIVKPSAMS